MSKFVIRRVDTGLKFDLCAENGEVIATSEVYTSRAAALRGIESVRACAAAGRIRDLTAPTECACSNPKFELFRDKRDACRFRLRARNGRIIAVSEAYTSHAAALSGIQSVIVNAPMAEIEETNH